MGGGSGGGREREISKTRYEKTGNFPGGLESRTVKADRQRIDASELWCWRSHNRKNGYIRKKKMEMVPN